MNNQQKWDNKIAIEKALIKQKAEILKTIEKMPRRFPDLESDLYDLAVSTTLNNVIKEIKKL